MAKLDKMPQQSIIDGMKGLVDYYYWKGISVARRWPRYFARTPTPDEATNQADFAYINKLYSQLALIIIVALKDHAAGTTQIGKDYLVRAYLKGLFELMPPEYYATEETQLDVLAQLDVPLSTRALEAGGNLAAILAQLDVALSTRALEAGGNLAEIHSRLDAIKLTPQYLTTSQRNGAVPSDNTWYYFLDYSGTGTLHSVIFTANHHQVHFRVYPDFSYISIPAADGASTLPLSPQNLNTLGSESALFKETLYDIPNTLFALHLKLPMPFSNRIRCGVRNNTGAPRNIAAYACYHLRT